MDERARASANAVAELARARGLTIAVAESVTAGHVASALAAGESASEWFMGSVVAYKTEMKQAVLGVTGDRVITRQCATQMVTGVIELTGADVAVSTTGAGGPDPEEGRPPGTVFIAVGNRRRQAVFEHRFGGSPEAVVAVAARAALEHLRLELERGRS